MTKPGLLNFKINKTANTQADITKADNTNWAENILGIPDMWRVTQGDGVKVAVLDTGIDTDHPDFVGAVVASKDFTGDGIEDANGHGTHTAGIIGARANGYGFVGVAPKCDLIIGKVLADDGYGSYEWIADGVDWAVAEGADIINLSLGGPYSDPSMFTAIYNALAAGVSVCCAGGNEGSLLQNSIGFPGRYGGVITVASHDHNGRPSGFSSRGGEIDIMAPGSDIWSTYLDGGYASLSGTSMASPFAAGVCALILAKHKVATSHTEIHNCEDMREHLVRMATHPGYHDNLEGYGPLAPFQYFYS